MVDDGDQGSDARSSLVAQRVAGVKFARFMTFAMCVLAVGWARILSVEDFGLPSWVRPVSAAVLVLAIICYAAMWWSRYRALQQLRTGE